MSRFYMKEMCQEDMYEEDVYEGHGYETSHTKDTMYHSCIVVFERAMLDSFHYLHSIVSHTNESTVIIA